MSDAALHIARLRHHLDHYELHDLTDDRVMHMYYKLMLWTFAVAIIAGDYQ